MDIVKSYNLHANCYVVKPVDLEQFIDVVKSIDNFWLTAVTLPIFCHCAAAATARQTINIAVKLKRAKNVLAFIRTLPPG